MTRSRKRARALRRPEHLVDRAFYNVEHGRFERSLSGLTAFAAVVTTAEIYLEHYRASFGHKMMWAPVVVTPPVVVAGIGGVFSRRWAKRYLPVAPGSTPPTGCSASITTRAGSPGAPVVMTATSWSTTWRWGRRSSRRGLMSIVGALGLLAAVLRREGG